ncbi:HyaD/HybD family hydrogenase maturation endopeptidase [Persephonella sp.]
MDKICVVGVGNVLFKDEGVGVYLVKYLEANYQFEPKIDLIDAGTLGFGLMRYLYEYDFVIIADTISINDKPGSVYRLTDKDISDIGSYHQTAHEVEVLQMLQITPLTGKMADVVIIGIVPEDISETKIGLSKTLEGTSFDTALNQILNELKLKGVRFKKIGNRSLKEVVIDFLGSYGDETGDSIWNKG